jgi:3-hydroxyisobutyrate dehydrogenase-like beta-hydroxyacid dehydrogenase
LLVVLGLGKMGLPMAALAKAAGFSLVGSDPSAQRIDMAQQRGIPTVSAEALPSQLGKASIVLSSLPDDAALLAVAAQLAGVCKGIWVDTSTVSPTTSAQAAKLCAAEGLEYVRATVSGNNHMLEQAQVTVMASGPADSYATVLPLLKCFGSQQFYLGAAEQARLMKLVINLMIVQTSSMLAEALTLGEKGGLDWQAMWQVISASAVGSPIVKAKAVQLSQRDFTPTFTVPQMIKDVDLMLSEASRLELPLPQLALTRQAMLAALAQGYAEQDYASIIRVAQAAAGISPK